MASKRTVIPAPPAREPQYGVVAAVPTIDEGSFDWTAGFTFNPEQCGVSGRVSIQCEGDTLDMSLGSNPSNVEGDPFVVFGSDVCSMIGYQSRDAEGRARRQLQATRSFQIADELWRGTLRDSDGLANRALVDVASDRLTGAAVAPDVALGMVEYALGRCGQGRRGMVHVSLAVLDALVHAQVIHQAGNLWVTPIGNIVVADAGYDGAGPGGVAAGSSQFMYGTSVLTLRFGPVALVADEMSQQLDRSVNTRTVVAAQPVAFVWDECCHVAAEVNVAVPAIGGAS